MIKDNLEVRPFNLKQIVEQSANIPRDGGAKFGGEAQKLSPQQKKDLQQKVAKFNEYGHVLRCETALMELSKTLNEIGQMAESYAMTESGDYFQAETVKRDFNEVKKITKDFSKLAKDCHGGLLQLNALYEDIGMKLERYFEIQSLEEIAAAANISNGEQSAPAPVMGEVAEEEEGQLNENTQGQLNPIETYKAVGVKVGTATKQKDTARMKHFINWFKTAVGGENPEYANQAREAFNQGYREGTGVGTQPPAYPR